ncbi:SRPBCC family protein [Streptomyces sp. NPDC059248]|uniref:SRPBCC family protein n=1 Tax=Streptomyces sp. NPDC059248 TaxID=3346791 RepID=UPI0036A8035E
MDWFRYRFHCVWDLDAPPGAVFTALARPADYPRWWPQVREVTELGEDRGAARFGSVLPYELAVTARALRRDPEAGVLQVALHGDLEGWARWTVAPRGTGTRAVYDQEVEILRPLMRRLAVPCRPLFRANHAVMMRSGRRGLGRYLGSGHRI